MTDEASDSTSSKPKITRSRLGCLTCRQRRKKCSGDRSEDCNACTRLGLVCNWPAPGAPSRRTRVSDRDATPRLPDSVPAPSLQQVIPPADEVTSTDTRSPSQPNPIAHLPLSLAFPIPTVYTSPFPTSSQRGSAPPVPTPSNSEQWTSQADPLLYEHPNEAAFQNSSGELDGLDYFQTELQNLAASALWFNATNDNISSSPELSHTSRTQFATYDPILVPPVIPGPAHLSSQSPSTLAPTQIKPTDTRFWRHFIADLATLVSCPDPSGSAHTADGFMAFAKHAGLPVASTDEEPSLPDFRTSLSSRSEPFAKRAVAVLQYSILAWAGKHLVNGGQAKYEVASEQYGSQASAELEKLLLERGARGSAVPSDDQEDLSLMAATLMVIQFKICRGDIWGFGLFWEQLRRLAASLYTVDTQNCEPGSVKYHFFENMAYHDILEPLIPTPVLASLTQRSPHVLRTLTGVAQPLLVITQRIGSLVRDRRSRPSGGPGIAAVFSDEELLTVMDEGKKIEQALDQEKSRIHALQTAHPHLSRHRYLHELLRVACSLQLRSQVYCEPSQSLPIRLLVRRGLNLLEEMMDGDLPGLCSIHWGLFITGLCANKDGHLPGQPDDRTRVETLYENFMAEFSFMNLGRSQKIIREVWSRNGKGKVFVDWVEVVHEYNWELFVV